MKSIAKKVVDKFGVARLKLLGRVSWRILATVAIFSYTVWIIMYFKWIGFYVMLGLGVSSLIIWFITALISETIKKEYGNDKFST